MLTELEIRNLGPIRAADVVLPHGMTAITGETGAGKSMLLNALALVRGGQAEPSKVSEGESGTWAQAVFDVAHDSPALTIARNAGVEVEDDELFLTRQVPQHGRSKAILCGHTVPRSLLEEISDHLITVHGQSDQLGLVAQNRQREFLDLYAGNAAQRGRFARSWQTFRDLDARLERLQSQQAEARQRADYLRESIEFIERVDPQPREDDELRAQRERIENAAAITDAVTHALAALDSSQMNDDPGAESVVQLLAGAAAALRNVRTIPDINQAADELEDLNAKVSEVVFSLTSQLDSSEGTDADLDHLNERIHTIGELTRRWGPELENVIAWRDAARSELEDMDASPEKLQELTDRRKKALDAAATAARKLHATRRTAAKELAEQVTEELASLAMPGAKLTISVTMRSGEDSLNANGSDDVAFMFTAFPGAGEHPLGKSASGGELSRLMLALELSLADKMERLKRERDSKAAEADADEDAQAAPVIQKDADTPTTFVFDEVDAGVGGESAVDLGKRLARLATSAQVIVVTHLAQVASWADAQFVVSKAESSDADQSARIETTVTRVEGESRVAEIARMLSGSESETSLLHAEELLRSSVLPQANQPSLEQFLEAEDFRTDNAHSAPGARTMQNGRPAQQSARGTDTGRQQTEVSPKKAGRSKAGK